MRHPCLYLDSALAISVRNVKPFTLGLKYRQVSIKPNLSRSVKLALSIGVNPDIFSLSYLLYSCMSISLWATFRSPVKTTALIYYS